MARRRQPGRQSWSRRTGDVNCTSKSKTTFLTRSLQSDSVPFTTVLQPGCEQYKELAEGQLPQADDATEGEEGDGGAVQEGSEALGKAVGEGGQV